MTEDDIAVAFAALRADIAALQQRVRMLESGVRPSLVPPHPEPGAVMSDKWKHIE